MRELDFWGGQPNLKVEICSFACRLDLGTQTSCSLKQNVREGAEGAGKSRSNSDSSWRSRVQEALWTPQMGLRGQSSSLFLENVWVQCCKAMDKVFLPGRSRWWHVGAYRWQLQPYHISGALLAEIEPVQRLKAFHQDQTLRIKSSKK